MKLPGVGKKTAERLVIEMRDKFKTAPGKAPSISMGDSLLSDAMNALVNLGYNPMQAQKAVQSVFDEKNTEQDLGTLISSALQKI